jgi:hypothetical protein
MDKFIVLVKGQIAHYENQVERFSPNHPRYRPDQIALYRRLIAEHRDLLAYLENQRSLQGAAAPSVKTAMAPPQPTDPATVDRVPTVRAELSDLPPELLAELSESARGEVDQLIQVIDGRGGEASLDEILIDLYRKHGEIGKRNIIANKLYRLSKRDLVWSVSGKKGVYTTTPVAVGVVMDDDDTVRESSEGSDDGTSEPSISTGAAGSPEGPSKPSPVGSTPTASTKRRRDLFAGAAIPSVRVPR